MDGISQTFAWGVFLFCVGALGSAVLGLMRVLLGRLVRMAARLQPTRAIVRKDERAVTRLVGLALPPSFRAPFRFEYQVAGKSYIGDLASLQAMPRARAAAGAALAAREPGETITVFYDRDHPARSVVDGRPPEVPAWLGLGAIVAAVVTIVGLAMIVVGY